MRAVVLAALAIAGCTGRAATGSREPWVVAPDTGATDTGPVDTATGETGDTASDCVIEPDTAGLCHLTDCTESATPVQGEPSAVTERRSSDATRYAVDAADGCATAAGDLRLECVDVHLAFDPIAAPDDYGASYAPRWIGDLDMDGSEDLLFQWTGTGDDVDDTRNHALIYGGERLESGALSDRQHAFGTSVGGFAVAIGDVTGDGQGDILLEVEPLDWYDGVGTGMAVHDGGRTRHAGPVFSWPTGLPSWGGGSRSV